MMAVAEMVDVDGMWYMGKKYFDGNGVAIDEIAAFECFSKAAKLGHADSQGMIGWMYEHGMGIGKDQKAAVEWQCRAAKNGSSIGKARLGHFYRWGKGVPRDTRVSAEWYRQAAEQGHSGARGMLGYMYLIGSGVEKDEKKAVEWMTQSDEFGKTGLSWAYLNRRGVEKDAKGAFDLMKHAAEENYFLAQLNLGWMYASGIGVTRDRVQSREWYRRAAPKAVSEGLCIIPDGADENIERYAEAALDFYRRSNAINSDPYKAYIIGWMYENGEGVGNEIRLLIHNALLLIPAFASFPPGIVPLCVGYVGNESIYMAMEWYKRSDTILAKEALVSLVRTL